MDDAAYERRNAALKLREAVLDMAARYADAQTELALGEPMLYARFPKGKRDTDDARWRAARRRHTALMRLSMALAKMAGA